MGGSMDEGMNEWMNERVNMKRWSLVLTEELSESLHESNLFYHKTHVDRLRTKPRPACWEASDERPEARHRMREIEILNSDNSILVCDAV